MSIRKPSSVMFRWVSSVVLRVLRIRDEQGETTRKTPVLKQIHPKLIRKGNVLQGEWISEFIEQSVVYTCIQAPPAPSGLQGISIHLCQFQIPLAYSLSTPNPPSVSPFLRFKPNGCGNSIRGPEGNSTPSLP